MTRWFWITGLPAIFLCGCAYAATVSGDDAAVATRGWLQASPVPLGVSLSATSGSVATARDADGTALYHVVSLAPEGFVICSADTRGEPILAFSASGPFEADPGNPLYALTERDARGRQRIIRAQSAKSTLDGVQAKAAAKWRALRAAAEGRLGPKSSGLGLVDDPRVDPFIESRWSQDTVGGAACYNYYTPPYAAGSADNYVCGCSSTAWAQLMRYHQYPTSPVGSSSFQIRVDGLLTNRSLRGGDGSGGPYQWNLMPLDPVAPATAERQAIGALCADIGVASGTSYAAGISTAWTSAQTLTEVFLYSNVCPAADARYFADAVRPNLDGRMPVALGISGPDGGHLVLCDGYGFNFGSTYYHLNLGWGGLADAWYNLPDVDTDEYLFDTISGYSYNIYTSGTGEIISGRVLDAGAPVAAAVVDAVGEGYAGSAVTDARGIYALAKVPSDSEFVLSARKGGAEFYRLTVFTGLSSDSATGNAGSNDISRVLPLEFPMLTVTAGSGSGSYTNGAQVAIVADAPAVGQVFDRWMGDTAYVADATAASTTVTMPARNITVTASLTKPDNLTCSTSRGQVTITGYTCSASAVVIPATIAGKAVVSIGDYAFSDCTSLTSVTVPSSVTSIGEWAFGDCISLEGVYFGGDAPSLASELCYYLDIGTVYYLAGARGYGSAFGGCPTALWPGPTLTGMDPPHGPAAGGTSVVITGSHFTGVTAVRFGATVATAFTVTSATRITATAPPGTVGQAVHVSVATPGGTSANTAADDYTYDTPPPTLTGLNPIHGSTAGGTRVVITGTGLAGVTAVRFGAVPATSFAVDSATQITAIAPPGTVGQTVHVSVTTAGGTSANTAADDYTYEALLAVGTAAVAAGRGLWDLSGAYATNVGGYPLALSLVHDTWGKLVGTATLQVNTGKEMVALAMPVKGNVKGSGGSVVMALRVKGVDSARRLSASLSFDLSLEATTRQLSGPVRGSLMVNGVPTRIAEPVALGLPLAMDGTWSLRFELVQGARSSSGTATLTLANGVEHLFAVTGRAVGSAAVLSLTGLPTDPAAKGIKIKTTIEALGGLLTTPAAFSGKGYGQTLVWWVPWVSRGAPLKGRP